MPIVNVKGLLTQATAYPAAIEAKLPEGAPKVSTMLLDTAVKIPVVPDFPMAVPDLPAVPELPGMPELGRGGAVRVVPMTMEALSFMGQEILS